MNLFIGCSGTDNVEEESIENSINLIDRLSKEKDINLVFGAYHKGLMGKSFKNFKNNNKKVFGITIDIYEDQTNDGDYDKLIYNSNTFDRTKGLYNNSDVLLFLPGGLGSFAELFSFMKENEETLNNKKIILYNDGFFFTPLIEYLYKLYKQGYIKNSISDYIFISNDIEEIIDLIKKEINDGKVNNGKTSCLL